MAIAVKATPPSARWWFATSDGKRLAGAGPGLDRILKYGAAFVNGMAHRNMFVNLPVKDLERSKAFFSKLGYSFNPKFSDEKAACLVLGENLFAMLLTEKFFATFTPKAIADARKTAEVLVSLDHESRDAVDRIVRAALAGGAREHRKAKDHGFMYEWGFEDLDGHIWEHFWMDPKAAAEGPPGTE